jgi:hypothetical protein
MKLEHFSGVDRFGISVCVLIALGAVVFVVLFMIHFGVW